MGFEQHREPASGLSRETRTLGYVCRALSTALTGAVLALAAPAAAANEPRLAFDRQVVHAGARIVATTRGTALLGDKGPFWVFLAKRELVFQLHGLGDPRLHYVGRLKVDERGNGRLRFRVPRLAPGFYIAELACDHCGARGLEPVGPFPGDLRIVR